LQNTNPARAKPPGGVHEHALPHSWRGYFRRLNQRMLRPPKIASIIPAGSGTVTVGIVEMLPE
jgi:hypothetical protein